MASLDELKAQASVLAANDSDAAFYLSQGAIPFKVDVGTQIFAPGGGPLFPGYTYYNGGNLGVFVPTHGVGDVVPANPIFIAPPQNNTGALRATEDFFDPKKNQGFIPIYTALTAGVGGAFFGGAAATDAPVFTGADAALGNNVAVGAGTASGATTATTSNFVEPVGEDVATGSGAPTAETTQAEQAFTANASTVGGGSVISALQSANAVAATVATVERLLGGGKAPAQPAPSSSGGGLTFFLPPAESAAPSRFSQSTGGGAGPRASSGLLGSTWSQVLVGVVVALGLGFLFMKG